MRGPNLKPKNQNKLKKRGKQGGIIWGNGFSNGRCGTSFFGGRKNKKEKMRKELRKIEKEGNRVDDEDGYWVPVQKKSKF